MDVLWAAGSRRYEVAEDRAALDRIWVDSKRKLLDLVGAHRVDAGPGLLTDEATYEAVVRSLATRLGF